MSNGPQVMRSVLRRCQSNLHRPTPVLTVAFALALTLIAGGGSAVSSDL